MKLTGAQIVLECLLEQGVDTVFGYPGGAVLNLYDALYEYSDRVRHVLTAHEQGASHAADGYARSTGRTGVVIATSGPGATNLVTGLATAYMDSIPVVAITGNVAVGLLGLDSFQEVDITGITMPITKHNYIVKDVNDLAGILREAFTVAAEGRPGPVLIDIPKDITAHQTEFQPQMPTHATPATTPTADAIQAALTALQVSERPFVYTGGGVISSGCAAEVATLVGLLDAPVASSLMGQGGFDNTNPRYMGMLGMHGTVTSSKAITDCDLLVALGTRFSDRVIGDIQSFAPHATILHVDIDPAEINKNIKVHLQLVGDLKAILSKLNAALPQQVHSNWMGKITAWKAQFPLLQEECTPEEVTPQYVLETLDRLTNGNAIITTEVGQHQMWTAQYFNFRTPRSFLSSGGLGTMGYGLGAAIGAQIANPEKQVINIAGDGSFHMNCNELVTLYKQKVPLIELLFNNSVLGMVRQWQRLFYGKRFSQTTLERGTDYVMLANAYRIKGLRIEKKSDVEPILQEALAANKPVLIECIIDRDINVLPMIPPGGALNKPVTAISLD